MSSNTKTAPRIVVVDGANGFRRLIATYLLAKWPSATVEEVDPFSQTLLGPEIVFGTSGDVVVMGGIGTVKEGISILHRLRNRPQCPPVVLLVAQQLADDVDQFIAAGAAGVLFKDALSQAALCRLVGRLLLHDLPLFSPPPMSVTLTEQGGQPSDPANHKPSKPKTFGTFSFVKAGISGETICVNIQGYRYIATLASSPMAQVFLAEQIAQGTDKRDIPKPGHPDEHQKHDKRSAHQRAVIKVLTASPTNNFDGITRFCWRYQFIHSLQGHHVVRYLDMGIAGAWPYAVLEYLADGNLRRIMSVDPTTADDLATVRIMHGLAEALSAVHAGNIAHLDLKPENVFFRVGGTGKNEITLRHAQSSSQSPCELVLIDFNISAPFGRTAKSTLATNLLGGGEGAGAPVLGTPAYMSPEQGQGLPIDGRSDLYSLGAIFFEMLAGEKPYAAKNDAELLYRHIHDEIPLLPKRARQFQPIVDRLMAKRPEERYATATELSESLAPFLADA